MILNTNSKCLVCNSKTALIFKYKKHFYYRCPLCKTVSTYPLHSSKDIEKHYKNNFDVGNYNLLRKYEIYYQNVYEGFRDRIQKYINKYGNGKYKYLLDVGCFTGGFLKIMENAGYDIRGVELQKEAVQLSDDHYRNKIFIGDYVKYHEKKQKFDIISLNGFIEHVNNPNIILKKTSLLMRKGGVIFLQTPDSSSILAYLMKKYWPPYEPVEHVHLFSSKGITKILKKYGFENIKIYNHIKTLRVSYVYGNLKTFGSETYRILKYFDFIIKKINIRLPFYIGEIVVMATKK